MKILKLKNLVFSLMAIMTLSILMISCEQEPLGIVEDDIDGIRPAELHDINGTIDEANTARLESEVMPPLPEAVMDGEELRNSCPMMSLSGMNQTVRSCTSTYVYGYGATGHDKIYRLYGDYNEPVRVKITDSYYAAFTGLEEGKAYHYNVRTICNGVEGSNTGAIVFKVRCP